MTPDEQTKLIINIDKNLLVLINRVNQEIDSNKDFKDEVRAVNSDQEKRLRAVEDWKSITEVKQENEKFMKRTMIRWVAANIVTAASAIAGVIYVLLTKGL